MKFIILDVTESGIFQNILYLMNILYITDLSICKVCYS